MDITPTIPTVVFPHEIDQFTITGVTTDTPITITLGTTTILSATLTPTPQGTIPFTDMAAYISERMQAIALDGYTPLTLTIAAAGTTLATTTLRYCTATLTATAQDVIRDAFLTTAVAGIKTIPADSCEEYLAWAPQSATERRQGPLIRATWYSPTLHRTAITEQILPILHKTTHTAIANVSPATLQPPATGYHLTAYTATLAARTMRYQIAPTGLTQATTPTTLTFTNIFGLADRFYFYGTLTTQVKPTYTAARIGSATTNYHIEANPTYTATTGPLNPSTHALLRDLLTARQVWMGTTPVTLTEADYKTTDSPTDIQTATVTFRRQTEGITQPDILPHSTFDTTFDYTFD